MIHPSIPPCKVQKPPADGDITKTHGLALPSPRMTYPMRQCLSSSTAQSWWDLRLSASVLLVVVIWCSGSWLENTRSVCRGSCSANAYSTGGMRTAKARSAVSFWGSRQSRDSPHRFIFIQNQQIYTAISALTCQKPGRAMWNR